MEKRLKNYIEYISNIEFGKMNQTEKEVLRREMLVNIGFFQHERLIHLIVTVLFALLMAFSIWGCVVIASIGFFSLNLAVLILLIPYIRHYYILENGVQKLYSLYDELVK